MLFPFRAILFGLVAGAAFFFIGFPIFFFIFFVFIGSRLVFGARRWAYGRGHYRSEHFALPIDGDRPPVPHMRRGNGQHITID